MSRRALRRRTLDVPAGARGAGRTRTVAASVIPQEERGRTLREELRALPALVGEPPPFDPAEVPAGPHELFLRWFREAVDAEVPEPHAMTLSTADDAGLPDARVLLLKDLTPEGWWFASDEASAKGRQLAGNPRAAVTFYWGSLARSVRIRGEVTHGSRAQAAEDFLARGAGARAVALVGRSGSPVGRADVDAEIDAALRRVEADPGLVAEDWSLWCVHATSVEFWQAHPERRHVRVRYERPHGGDAWRTAVLWP
ncbi:pyridoxal 5'-phosphate synthase [Streptomyces sp. ISL-90]|nr:pyridoxal 5'-phosphate synthase [Streptomyces sp. ISL-90]